MKLGFLLALFFSLFVSSSFAAESEVNFYEIKNIAISGESREAAILEGQKKAMEHLQQKLKANGYVTQIIPISDMQLNNAINSIEVKDERILTRSYRAKLNVVFGHKEISRIFSIGFIKPTPIPDKYLIIPILNDEDGTKIWRHKWWEALKKSKNKNMILPVGDLEDVRSFTKEDHSIHDYRNLVKLQKKYEATAILIARAEYITQEKNLHLEVERFKAGESETYTYELMGDDKSTEDKLFSEAAAELVRKIDKNNFDDSFDPEEDNQDYPEDKKTSQGQANAKEQENQLEDTIIPEELEITHSISKTDVFVIAKDLFSWGRIRAKIMETSVVKNIRIKSFTAGKAFITIEHSGSFEEVKNIFLEKGLAVSNGAKYPEIRERDFP